MLLHSCRVGDVHAKRVFVYVWQVLMVIHKANVVNELLETYQSEVLDHPHRLKLPTWAPPPLSPPPHSPILICYQNWRNHYEEYATTVWMNQSVSWTGRSDGSKLLRNWHRSVAMEMEFCHSILGRLLLGTINKERVYKTIKNVMRQWSFIFDWQS